MCYINSVMKLKSLSKNLFHQENAFPDTVALRILEKFKKNKKWQLINQIKKKHYSHVFKNSSDFLPDANEKYLAHFYRSDSLSLDQYINNSIKRYIISKIEKKFKIAVKNVDIRCHKFLADDFARTHFDNYAGDYAVTINLNKNWKWDWGGLLCIPYGKKFDKTFALAPFWNTMNILTSTNGKESPHFVTKINSFAKSPRYSITLFIK